MSVQNKKVVIMRGISGAGKSTYVKKHFPNAVICSADNYFIRPNGQYVFNRAELPLAHASCKEKFEKALQEGEPLVVTDNTNTTEWEMKPYIKLANQYGYEVEVIRLNVPVDVAAKRNAHGVPSGAVQSMHNRMVDYPGEKLISQQEE